MAERPVFVPTVSGTRMVAAVPVQFTWHPGMSATQKKKNVAELHGAAEARGLNHLLEISSKSDREIGRRLSAFHQRVRAGSRDIPLECAYQGSKVFEFGGPYIDLFELEPREAKRDERLKNSGRLIAFEFESKRYPITPTTVFYDWLYTNALLPEREWLKRLGKMDGFTDIEFNPERSLNCQARACALFVALEKRGLLDDAMSSFDRFIEIERNAFALG
jgi:hypothetical protein